MDRHWPGVWMVQYKTVDLLYCVKYEVADWKWFQRHGGFSIERSSSFAVHVFNALSGLYVSTWKIFPLNMLTQSAVPQGWLSNTITYTQRQTHAHSNAPPGCGDAVYRWCCDGLRGALTINSTVARSYFPSHKLSHTGSHVYEIMSHGDAEFLISTTVDTTLCYLDDVTFSNPLILRQISFWEPHPGRGCKRVLWGYWTTRCGEIDGVTINLWSSVGGLKWPIELEWDFNESVLMVSGTCAHKRVLRNKQSKLAGIHLLRTFIEYSCQTRP